MDELIERFKSEYKKLGNRDLLYQVPYLSKLAHKYAEQTDWASLLRAHALYNSCAVRDTENKEHWLQMAFHMQVKYWEAQADLQSFPAHLQVAQALKLQLEEIRKRARRQLQIIGEHFKILNCEPDKLACPENQELFTQILHDIPHLSNSVNQDMIAFSRSVVEKALGICGPASSKFCVVALGSMARGEMTPYSDLEFLLLTESESDEAIGYFQKLSVTIYFLIGNLCETKLKVMAIPELMTWDDQKEKYVAHWFDDAGMSGFKIDGLGSWAGNIPTGGTPEQNNQFICTVDNLVARYQSILDVADEKKSLTGDLTAMLANTAFISGDQKLHDNLRAKINAIHPNDKRRAATVDMLVNDVKKFNFKPDKDLTQKRHLKGDIYRYPSILTLNLKILHEIPNCNPWDIIDKLELASFISDLAARSLRFSFCCALFIRLSAYLYHNSQDESISVLSSSQDENLYKGAWYVQPEVLVHMFIHLVPLKDAVSKVASDPSRRIDMEITKRSRVETVALVAYHCEDYQKVLSLLRAEYPDGLDSDDSYVRKMYIYSAIECNECSEAELLIGKRILLQNYDADDFYLLGRVHEAQCRFSDALDAYKARLVLLNKKTLTKNVRVDIAQSLCDIGVILMRQARFAKALVEYRKCLEMRVELYEGKDHAQIANIFCNIGVVLDYQSRYAEALEEHQKCLDMRLKLYGDRDHLRIAAVLCNIGSVWDSLAQYDKAMVQYRKSADMYTRIYLGRPHPDIADTLCNLGVVLYNQDKYAEALVEYRKCLDMYNSIYKGKDQVVVADVLCNIGVALRNQGKDAEALLEYEKCLAMRRQIYGEKHHPDIADIVCNMGVILRGQKKLSKAMANFNEGLDMYNMIYAGQDHIDIADVLSNIGGTLFEQGKHAEALVEYRRSLNVYIGVFGNTDHPSITRVRDAIKSLE